MADIHHYDWRHVGAERQTGLRVRWGRVAIFAGCLAFHVAWIAALVSALH